MKENEKKAFDFAADLTKQLIALSTGIIGLTVTFSKDIIGNIDDSNRYILLFSWIVFIISIFLGVMTLMALTGNLDPMPKKQAKKEDGSTPEYVKPKPILTITSGNVISTAQWQVGTFLLAMCLTCWYGYRAVTTPEIPSQDKETYMIIHDSRSGIDSLTDFDTLVITKVNVK